MLRCHATDGTVAVVAIGVYPGTFDPLTVAHLAVAEAAITHLRLERLDFAISVRALGKEHVDEASISLRVDAINAAVADHPHLAVVVVDARLVVDVAAGYDAVVMGADKWTQVIDPSWYGNDPAARDAAVQRLPLVAVAPRSGFDVPPELLLPVPAGFEHVSSTAVRGGRDDWAAGPISDGTAS